MCSSKKKVVKLYAFSKGCYIFKIWKELRNIAEEWQSRLYQNTVDFKLAFNSVHVNLNANQAKSMSLNARPANIVISHDQVVNVNQFTYLGNVITTDGRVEADVKIRVSNAKTLNSLVWKSKIKIRT